MKQHGKHSETVGFGLNKQSETHLAWMILYWKIKLEKRPKWDSELTVKTWVSEFTKVSSWREFEVYFEEERTAEI